jgi:regulator of sigma D
MKKLPLIIYFPVKVYFFLFPSVTMKIRQKKQEIRDMLKIQNENECRPDLNQREIDDLCEELLDLIISSRSTNRFKKRLEFVGQYTSQSETKNRVQMYLAITENIQVSGSFQ